MLRLGVEGLNYTQLAQCQLSFRILNDRAAYHREYSGDSWDLYGLGARAIE